MKLYLAIGACSQAPHICLREIGATFDVAKVDLRSKKLADGSDFLAINPKGFVPVLELDSGERLSEVSAILQYIVDKHPSSNLAPAAGTMERYRWLEWLGFINSELHKGIGALFHTDEAGREKALANAKKHINTIEKALEGREWLLGDHFSAVDAYLFVILSWTKWVKIDLAEFKNCSAFVARVVERPSVKEARAAER